MAHKYLLYFLITFNSVSYFTLFYFQENYYFLKSIYYFDKTLKLYFHSLVLKITINSIYFTNF